MPSPEGKTLDIYIIFAPKRAFQPCEISILAPDLLL